MNGHLYRLDSRDATGVFLGLSVVECALIGAGLATTIGLRLAGLPVVIAALPVLSAAATAKVRVAGRPVHQWLGLLATRGATVLRRRHHWRASLPLLPAPDASATPTPPMLDGLDVVEVRDGARTLAAVRDRRRACLTAVVPVQGTRFAGQTRSVQDALLSAWGAALAAHAGGDGAVVQVGWSHHGMRTALGDHRDWLTEVRAGGATGVGDPAGYDDLVEAVAEQAVAHDTVVWVTVAGTEAAGRGRLLDRASAALPPAVDLLVASLRDAGLSVDEPLALPGLWRLIRQRSDPDDSDDGGGGSLATRMGLLGASKGNPLAVDTAWSEVRIDGTWHRVYWVEAWPRRPVEADWLAPFLSSITSGTMTVAYRPVDPERSRRRVDGQLVKLSAHRARKEDKARRVTESERRTEQAAHELEAELVAGYAEMLYLGLVCVSAPTLDDLDTECQVVEHAARASQLGLRVLHGRQDLAWAAALPFGVATPSLSDEVGL